MKIENRSVAFFAALAAALTLTAPAIAIEANLRPDGIDAAAGVIASPAANPYVETDGAQGAQRPGNVERVSPHDPKEPVRVVIELKDQPLMPYLQQLRAEQASAVTSGARISAREQRSELAQAIDSQRSVLEQAQTRLISDLRRDGWIKQEHWRFTGLLNAVAITTQYEHLSAIYDDPRVLTVRFDTKVQALLDTSVGVVGAPTAWGMLDGAGNTVTGQGITIAIIDTGIDYRHPDLGGCFGPGCKVIGGFDFVHGDEDPLDDNGHGTHVAGIAAANGGVRGVAPDAHLLAYKALDANGNGFNSVVIAAIERAVDPDGNPLTDDAVDVISMSLGSDEDSTGPLALAANRAMDAGVVAVAAAGNYGDYRSVQSPGVAERIVTVGAADNNGQIAGFSSRGPVEDKDFVKPELVAPGVDIRSTWLAGDYHVLSGTSMAAPHVAGAAALLRQRHPTLDPQEIKALLVNNARDLGRDVFTQGAGMLDVAAAALAQVVITPAIPSFGGVAIEQPQWQAQLPVTVKNISTQDWAATVQSATPPPLGARVAFSQPEGLAVAPGQTATFDLGVTVDNQLLPFPAAPTLHHESALSLGNAAGNLRLPWMLFKSATLDLVIHGRPNIIIVSSGDNCGGFPCWRPFQEANCLVWDAQNSATRSIRVSPGKYHAFAIYADPFGSCEGFTKSVVFKDVDISSSATLLIDDADAKNRIHVGDIVDPAGMVIAPQRLKIVGSTFNFYHSESTLAFFIGLSAIPRDGDTIVRISDVPDGYRLNVDAVAIDIDSSFLHRQYFVLGDLLAGGLHGDAALELDASSGGGVTFQYSDTKELASGVYFWPGAGLISSPSGALILANSMGGPAQGPYFSPFKVTAYAARPAWYAGERGPELLLTRFVDGNGGRKLKRLVDTNPVAIHNDNEYIKFDGTAPESTGNIDLTHVDFIENGNAVNISSGPTYFSAKFYYLAFNRQFTPVSSTNVQGYVQYAFSDVRQNLMAEDVNYKVTCDGSSVLDESIDVLQIRFLNRECVKIRAMFSFPTGLFGHTATSTAEVNLDANLAADSPVVKGLTFTSDGRVTRVLNGSVSRLRLKASRGFFSSNSTDFLSVMADYRLDDTAAWTPLVLTRDGDGYLAALPVIDGAHIGSLRIQLHDLFGSSMTQTLNSLFLIGKDATSLAGSAVPRFGNLPELTVSATGPLTAFTAPPVTANDSLDGTIAATADNKGPYPLGRNVIRWTAVNSADVMGTAIQTLNVVDMTPPQITPPPAVVRSASGLFTPVDLGQVSAVDQIDGSLSAVPSSTGPFGVGDTVVTWSATDAAGNVGSATQLVSITANEALPVQSVSSASEAGTRYSMLTALPELPDARFAGTPLVTPVVVSATRTVDDSPTLPYDALRDGTLWMPIAIPATPTDAAREYLLLAIADSTSAQELHLFVGEDGNGNGPELAEQRCANTTNAKPSICELRIAREAGAAAATYWVLVQNIRSGAGNSDLIALRAAAVPLIPENKALVVTGPGHVAAGRDFTYRATWDDPDWLPGEERVAYVLVYASPDELAYYEPLWLKRESAAAAPYMLTPGVPRTLSLAPGQAHGRLYVDIPANATAVTFRSTGSDAVDLYASHVPTPVGPGIAPAPARDAAQHVSQPAGDEKTVALSGSQVLPGRWYLTPVNHGISNAQVNISASIDARTAAPLLRPGHYFNPARSGQGVFIDFAGDQWVMVWYAYLEDGTPTWYIGQNVAPAADQSQWSSPLYRVSWNGSSAHATTVGNVNLTVLPGSAEASPKLTMSFNLDGDSGSEPLTRLGDDRCPIFGGAPLDANGHWYSPARSGFGYSVQFQATSEFHAAYVYDDLGYPRWLIGQKDLDTDNPDVPLLQVAGFCPTCEAVTPTTAGVGVLKRFIAGTSNNDGKPGLVRVDVDASFAPPLSGTWQQSLPVFMLTQRNGCN